MIIKYKKEDVSNWFMIGMMRLYIKVRRSRSSAIDGINLGSPADVPELQMQKKQQFTFV